MAVTPRLELQHSQSLIMTPQLQQAIKLLQLSNQELNEFVEEELAENPLLERAGDESSQDSRMAEEHGANDAFDDDGSLTSEAPENSDGEEFLDLQREKHVSEDQVNALDMEEFGNVWEQDTAPGPELGDNGIIAEWGIGGKIASEDPGYSLEQTLSQKTSLRDHLISQIHMDLKDPKERMIAVYLTDHLDENGRLSDGLGELANHLKCDLAKMDHVLSQIQKFDPPGIFARSLPECWTIQLRERNHLDPAMATLLENIELLKIHDYQSLAKLCHVNVDDIQDMVNEIWSLTHNPSEAFDQIVTQPVTPDVTMRPGLQGKWIVELNTAVLPKVLANNTYYREICGNIRTKAEKQYITEKLQWANWLVKSLHQRATTILKVSSEIVSQQEKFFDLGVEHLRPLVLRDIAEEIEMHESTVSRVTSNKYIDTPRGIFELKFFFTTAIGSSNGGDYFSSEAVRHKIKILIGRERQNAILSDDKLVELLKIEGVGIARRTVAKYREAMKIPSSVQRRKQKIEPAVLT